MQATRCSQTAIQCVRSRTASSLKSMARCGRPGLPLPACSPATVLITAWVLARQDGADSLPVSAPCCRRVARLASAAVQLRQPHLVKAVEPLLCPPIALGSRAVGEQSSEGATAADVTRVSARSGKRWAACTWTRALTRRRRRQRRRWRTPTARWWTSSSPSGSRCARVARRFCQEACLPGVLLAGAHCDKVLSMLLLHGLLQYLQRPLHCRGCAGAALLR